MVRGRKFVKQEINADRCSFGYLDRYRRAAVSRLEASGVLATGESSLEIDGQAVSFATDPGPETFNDDFVALWEPAKSDSIKWAAAIADGVTGCLLAQEAAELACYAGLAAIAKAADGCAASASNPFRLANRLFHRLGKLAISDVESFRPADCPQSIWRIAAREGKFLQTTLTLVWSTTEGLRVVAVGDGGILYSYADAPTEITGHTFGTGKLECLGPRSFVQPEAYLLENWSRFVCYTDGLAEVIQQDRKMSKTLTDSSRSVASFISSLNADCPELVNDNISAIRAVKV